MRNFYAKSLQIERDYSLFISLYCFRWAYTVEGQRGGKKLIATGIQHAFSANLTKIDVISLCVVFASIILFSIC